LQDAFNVAPFKNSQYLPPNQVSVESSIDELKLEDDIDEIYSKWNVCKDLTD